MIKQQVLLFFPLFNCYEDTDTDEDQPQPENTSTDNSDFSDVSVFTRIYKCNMTEFCWCL